MTDATRIDVAIVGAGTLDDGAILTLAQVSPHGLALASLLSPDTRLGEFQAAVCGLVRDVVAGLAAQPPACRRRPDSDPFNTAPRRRKSDWPEIGTEGAST